MHYPVWRPLITLVAVPTRSRRRAVLLSTVFFSYRIGPQHDDSGCFGLDEEATIENEDIELVAGSTMTADTGLAVALGHAVSVLVSATHILFFVLLYFNM